MYPLCLGFASSYRGWVGRKLYYLLEQPLQKLGVGRDKLYTILRANNLLIKPKRSYRTTTNSKHLFRKHENQVLDFVPTRPEQIWVSDITYIGGRSRSIYLALITDAYSKKIVGYDVSSSLDASGCVSLENGFEGVHISRQAIDTPLRQGYSVLLRCVSKNAGSLQDKSKYDTRLRPLC